MKFTKWLNEHYPETSANSAKTYELIQKARSNTRFFTIPIIAGIYFFSFYIATMLATYYGEHLASGVIGWLFLIAASIVGAVIFTFVNNKMIKNELRKIIKSNSF